MSEFVDSDISGGEYGMVMVGRVVGRTVFRCCLSVLVLGAIAVCDVQADGKFFRRYELVEEPHINAQRAAIIHRDGMETVIVQSDINAGGDSIGWVLPLPATPISVEACEPYVLTSLESLAAPSFVQVDRMEVVAAAVLLVFCLAAIVRRFALRDGRPDIVYAAWCIAGVVIFVFAGMMGLPTLGRAGVAPGPALRTLLHAQAGVYDVEVVQSPDGRAVYDWLESNNFAVPPTAKPVIEDYAKKGWCFLAAKLSADADHAVTQHPLKIKFPAKQAIYPVRLTGVDAEPLHLDLYVFADEAVSASHLRKQACVAVEEVDDYYFRVPWSDAVESRESINVWGGRDRRGRAHHATGAPGIVEDLWRGCWLTKFSGELSARDMRNDVLFNKEEPAPYLRRVYTHKHAALRSLAVAVLYLALATVIVGYFGLKRGWSDGKTVRMLVTRGGGIALLVAGGFFAVADKVNAKRVDFRQVWGLHFLHAHASAYEAYEDAPVGTFSPATYDEAFEAKMDEWAALEGELVNRPKRRKANLVTLGDYTIEEAVGGWRLRILWNNYIPATYLLPAKANGSSDKPAETEEMNE